MRLEKGKKGIDLGSNPKGSSRSIGGYTLNTLQLTQFTAGPTDAGGLGVGFKGLLEVELPGQPDVAFTRGAVDLLTGDFEFDGFVPVIGNRFSSVSVVGNIAEGRAHTRVKLFGIWKKDDDVKSSP